MFLTFHIQKSPVTFSNFFSKGVLRNRRVWCSSVYVQTNELLSIVFFLSFVAMFGIQYKFYVYIIFYFGIGRGIMHLEIELTVGLVFARDFALCVSVLEHQNSWHS